MTLSANVTLSESELDRFNESLQAAVVARVPLPWSPSVLHAFHARVRGRLIENIPLDQTLAADESLPNRYRAALSVFANTNSLDLVLDGLTTQKLARRDLARVVRRTMLYLAALLFLAAVLTSFFSELIAPQIMQMRTDMKLVPAVASQHTNTLRWLPTLFMILSTASIAVLVVLLTGGSSIVTWCLGGRSYQSSAESATVLLIAERLVSRCMRVEEAIDTALDLVAAGSIVRNRVRSVARQHDSDSGKTSDFSVMAGNFQSVAANRLSTLRVVLPMLLVSVIGGAAAMAYSLSVFWPIVALLKDLALPGVQT